MQPHMAMARQVLLLLKALSHEWHLLPSRQHTPTATALCGALIPSLQAGSGLSSEGQPIFTPLHLLLLTDPSSSWLQRLVSCSSSAPHLQKALHTSMPALDSAMAAGQSYPAATLQALLCQQLRSGTAPPLHSFMVWGVAWACIMLPPSESALPEAEEVAATLLNSLILAHQAGRPLHPAWNHALACLAEHQPGIMAPVVALHVLRPLQQQLVAMSKEQQASPPSRNQAAAGVDDAARQSLLALASALCQPLAAHPGSLLPLADSARQPLQVLVDCTCGLLGTGQPLNYQGITLLHACVSAMAGALPDCCAHELPTLTALSSQLVATLTCSIAPLSNPHPLHNAAVLGALCMLAAGCAWVVPILAQAPPSLRVQLAQHIAQHFAEGEGAWLGDTTGRGHGLALLAAASALALSPQLQSELLGAGLLHHLLLDTLPAHLLGIGASLRLSVVAQDSLEQEQPPAAPTDVLQRLHATPHSDPGLWALVACQACLSWQQAAHHLLHPASSASALGGG